MKKFGIMVLCWLLFILIVIVGSALYDRFKTSPYDAQAIPYLERILPTLSTWEPEPIRALMAPDALENVSDEQFQQTIAIFSRLGRLRSHAKPRFRTLHAEAGVDDATRTIVEYLVKAEYESGPAEMVISLVQTDDRFMVYRFNLGAQALLNK
ncbi:MAG: hypothetical protein RQ723_03220 [Desulfuromonadales bacterium]|nr:hypothetical protein [Desulfuromonadales bacterium]